jgi:hypothetical protein
MTRLFLLLLIFMLGQHFWRDLASKRKFFEEVAARKGKDPLKPETWYTITKDDFVAVEVLCYYFYYLRVFYVYIYIYIYIFCVSVCVCCVVLRLFVYVVLR